MRHRDILISGASVAGPALAWWLARRGFRPIIVERSGQLRGGGYAVDFRGDVHLQVLRQMGLLEQIRARQTGLRSLTYVDEHGRPVASMPPVFFAGDVEVLRGDLAAILYEATRNDSEYIFGDSVTGLEQHGDGVHVTFSRSSPRTFDLVIGADGVHSNIRRLAFGPEEEFTYGLGLYVSIFTVPNFAGLDHAGLLYSIPGKTAGIFAAGDPDHAIAQLYFTGSGLRYQPRGDARQEQETVAGQFGGLGWHVPRLLAEMPATTDFYFDTTSQIRIDTWSSGRVALIGDAGYAAGPGGNGTGNAVVAAYILAGELAATPDDHAAAFARYEQQLRRYVAGAQKQAAGSHAFLAPSTWKKIRRRNRFYKMLPHLPVSGLISRAATKTATAITLPSYPRTAAGD
ncbi:MAG TPA: FAD-dependent monooxygenase [Streptosporangiaceae bacterium]|jgi:2-polyprenyl-6-methoxyphenol hydroxylase-like FAD-dependent oxidoreductase|nr:FAD-dependent monooxygenase [Streptosporangiaceae bacterium]